jgi:arylformamidase
MQVQQEVARNRLDVNQSGEPWVDVSVPIRAGMFHWPGSPEIVVSLIEDLRRGDIATTSALSLGVHTGTHVDAPVHFILGAAGVDSYELDRLIGPARVIDVGDVAQIRLRDIEGQGIGAGDRILFKTRNSRFWTDKDFRPDYASLSVEAARWLVERGVRTIGIDYLSIAAMDAAPETHQPLLGAGICVIEGLDLSRVAPGLYDLICMPLRLEGLDGAPARVVLRKSQQAPASASRSEGRSS